MTQETRATAVRIGIVIAILAFGAYAYTFASPEPCAEPIRYRIGSFDARFDITEAQFRQDIAAAADVWNTAAGRTLYAYDPEGSFTVNLVYDARQQMTEAEAQFQETLDSLKSSHDALASQYQETLDEYRAAAAAFEAASDSYERDLAAYNDEVESWNERGGAPPRTYASLQKQKADLAERGGALVAQQREVNALVDELNTLGRKTNAVATTYNRDVSKYTEHFGVEREFNEGEYQNGTVTVYQFDARDDLRLVLAHEFGHGLGLGHVENPESIMYYLMKDQDAANLTLTAEDLTEFGSVCGARD